MSLQIGRQGWVAELKTMTEPLGQEFWSDFTPCDPGELQDLRHQLQRPLPTDFEEFYLTIGWGDFPEIGSFYSPSDISESIGSSIWHALGSLYPGEEWCSEEEHQRLWLSRGADNPVPDRFTEHALTFGPVKLYDMLCFGSWGGAGYRYLHLPPTPSGIAYCEISCAFEFGSESSSSSAAVEDTIAEYLDLMDD